MPVQAVIMASCSDGENLYPLTEQMPSVLLPVANRHLLSFQLELLERAAGFKQAPHACLAIPPACVHPLRPSTPPEQASPPRPPPPPPSPSAAASTSASSSAASATIAYAAALP